MPARMHGSIVKSLQRLEKEFIVEMAVAVDKTAEVTRKKFEMAVRAWKNRLRFITRNITAERGLIRRHVVGQGNAKVVAIFRYVDEGTEPHLIFPKKANALAFKAGYSARTRPIANANAGTGKASGSQVFSKGVLHPGTEAREFTGFYALEAQEMLTNEIRAALKRLSKKRR